jgi:MoaA/NifB/PqqE/SkfB family radical SAM enzyme
MFKNMQQILRSFFSRSQVSYLILYVTNKCNFRCGFCFYHDEIQKGNKADELRLDEVEKISRGIGPLIQLSLTGGEPFLRNDLSEITEVFIRNTHVKYITVPTNASLTDRIVAYLERVLPGHPDTFFRIAFSIDAIGEAHDTLRKAPGAYKKMQRSYETVSPMRKKYGNLVLDCNSVFSSTNEDSIIETVRTIEHDFDFDNISATYIRGEVKDKELKKTSFNKYIELNNYLERSVRKRERRMLYPLWRAVRDVSREQLIRTVLHDKCVTPCTAGRKLLIIKETGEVYPCEILGRSMGNLRDYNFELRSLLARPSNLELLRWIEDSGCHCSFECALAANVLWGKSSLRKLISSFIRNIGANPGSYEKN